VGERRLARLNDEFDVRLERKFLEIHPGTPAGGMPVSGLGYPPGRWAAMMENLERMGAAEGIVFNERTFTTNSRKALLLAEAAKDADPGVFEALNEGLFRAYFTELRNIGDERVLREISQASGVPSHLVENAWRDASYEKRLERTLEDAARLDITGIPAFLLAGKRLIEGAVPMQTLREAARNLVGPAR
jgi:predicted DsbA family dithiol-disulfide isomerase